MKIRKISPQKIIGQIVSKPGHLEELCNNFTGPSHRSLPLGNTAYRQYRGHHGDMVAGTSKPTMLQDDVWLACNCQAQKRMHRRRLICLSMELYYDTVSEEEHFPSCSFSQFSNKKRRIWGIRSTGVTWLLTKAIQASFALRSGAGGFSMSASLKNFTVVDTQEAPAWRVMRLLMNSVRDIRYESITPVEQTDLLELGVTIIGKLFQEGKSSPTEVNSWQETLLYPIIILVCFLPNFAEQWTRLGPISNPTIGM